MLLSPIRLKHQGHFNTPDEDANLWGWYHPYSSFLCLLA